MRRERLGGSGAGRLCALGAVGRFRAVPRFFR
jgi:hypothetical protein